MRSATSFIYFSNRTSGLFRIRHGKLVPLLNTNHDVLERRKCSHCSCVHFILRRNTNSPNFHRRYVSSKTDLLGSSVVINPVEDLQKYVSK